MVEAAKDDFPKTMLFKKTQTESIKKAIRCPHVGSAIQVWV